jgi:hypothetical protein
LSKHQRLKIAEALCTVIIILIALMESLLRKSRFTSTGAEQQTLAAAYQLLGTNLANFLLSGLGETHINHHRTFNAGFISPSDSEMTHQLEMLNDSEQGLPRERDPLVLASVLGLLWKQMDLTIPVTFESSVLLSNLQWPDSPESNLIIQQAIERYFSTAYYLVDNNLPESERIEGPYSHCRKLLVAYDTSTDYSLEIPHQASSMMTVRFSPDFLEGISSERKFFLNLDFESLHSFRQIS